MVEDLLVRINDAQERDLVLDEFNRATLNDVGPFGGAEKGMKLLSEMNSMIEDYEEFVKSLAPTVNVA